MNKGFDVGLHRRVVWRHGDRHRLAHLSLLAHGQRHPRHHVGKRVVRRRHSDAIDRGLCIGRGLGFGGAEEQTGQTQIVGVGIFATDVIVDGLAHRQRESAVQARRLAGQQETLTRTIIEDGGRHPRSRTIDLAGNTGHGVRRTHLDVHGRAVHRQGQRAFAQGSPGGQGLGRRGTRLGQALHFHVKTGGLGAADGGGAHIVLGRGGGSHGIPARHAGQLAHRILQCGNQGLDLAEGSDLGLGRGRVDLELFERLFLQRNQLRDDALDVQAATDT